MSVASSATKAEAALLHALNTQRAKTAGPVTGEKPYTLPQMKDWFAPTAVKLRGTLGGPATVFRDNSEVYTSPERGKP